MERDVPEAMERETNDDDDDDRLEPYLSWARSMDIDRPLQREEEERSEIERGWDKVVALYEERNARVIYDPRRSVVFHEDERGLLRYRSGFQAPRMLGPRAGYSDLPPEMKSIIVKSMSDPSDRIRTMAVDRTHRSITKSLREVVKDVLSRIRPQGLTTSLMDIIGSRFLTDAISESFKDLGIPFGVFTVNESATVEYDLEIGQGTLIIHWGNAIGMGYIRYMKEDAILLEPGGMETGWEDPIHEGQIQLDYETDMREGCIVIHEVGYDEMQSYPRELWQHYPLIKELARILGQETGYFNRIDTPADISYAKYLESMKEK